MRKKTQDQLKEKQVKVEKPKKTERKTTKKKK
jgi:hypothetical protein